MTYLPGQAPEGANVSYYDHDNNKVVTIHCADVTDAAIITLLDRIAGALERWVDNRQ